MTEATEAVGNSPSNKHLTDVSFVQPGKKTIYSDTFTEHLGDDMCQS